MGTRKSLILHFDSLDVLDELSKEQIADLFIAIRDYNLGKDVELSGLMKAIFIPFKNQFDRDLGKYEKKCEINAENVKSRWNKNNIPTDTNDTTRINGIPTDTNDTYNKNDSDSKNDSNIDNIVDKLSKDNSVNAESSKPPKEDKRKPYINEMIAYMKEITTKHGIIYSSEKEREFTKHLFSKKFKEEITDKMKDVADQKSSIERLFLMASVRKFKNGKENFRHGKVLGPMQLYEKRADILNNYLQITKK